VAHTQDEGFHEIQLNGKQLVFLFMAATVVSVVIFLCGVLVGRGVRVERAAVAENTVVASVAETTPTPTPPPPAPPATPAVGSDPRAAAPPPPVDDLSYFNRLEKEKTPREELKPAAVQKPAAPKASEPPAKRREAEPPAKPREPESAAKARGDDRRPPPLKESPPERAVSAPAAEPAGAGYAVQIAALNVRDEAEAIAKRLSSKGYAAYVLAPASGGPSIYRVRIGKFPSRREAESIAAKLKKEEQLNPWVTR
jgi:DedD protein